MPLDKSGGAVRIQSKSHAGQPADRIVRLCSCMGGAILYRRSRLPVSETGTHEKNIIVMPRPGAAWPGRAFLDGRQKDPFIRRGGCQSTCIYGEIWTRQLAVPEVSSAQIQTTTGCTDKAKNASGYGKADRFARGLFRQRLITSSQNSASFDANGCGTYPAQTINGT